MIKKIELNEGQVALISEHQTRYENAEGELIATLPFPADEKITYILLVAWQTGHDQGVIHGRRQGRKALMDLFHELLGIDQIKRIADVLEEVHK